MVLLRLAKSYPFRFGMAYSLFKTSGCDLMVQKVVEKRENIDWKRNIAFGTFGLFYLGGVQYMIYVPLFSRLFPSAAAFSAKTISEKLADATGIRNLFLQVFLDQMVHHPLMYFPVFYMIKDFVTSESPDPVRAVGEYQVNMKEDLIALWKVWIPSTFINFAFMPMWGRIPWVASTSLIWTCILSAMRGGSDQVPVEKDKFFGQVDGRTLELMTRSTLGPAPRLKSDRSHLLVTIVGPDQPGIIKDITKQLYAKEASITHSKMMSLGPEFSIMMHVECEPAQARTVRSALVGVKNLDVTVRGIQPDKGVMDEPKFQGNVTLTGVDRPGLVYRLADVLVEYDLNIEHLQTEQHRTRGAGPQLFTTHCHVCGAEKPDVKALRTRLQKLEKELDVTCSLELSDLRLHRSVTK